MRGVATHGFGIEQETREVYAAAESTVLSEEPAEGKCGADRRVPRTITRAHLQGREDERRSYVRGETHRVEDRTYLQIREREPR